MEAEEGQSSIPCYLFDRASQRGSPDHRPAHLRVGEVKRGRELPFRRARLSVRDGASANRQFSDLKQHDLPCPPRPRRPRTRHSRHRVNLPKCAICSCPSNGSVPGRAEVSEAAIVEVSGHSLYRLLVDQPPNSLQTAGAFLTALAAFGLTGLLFDRTPLLVEPSPNLRWPLGLLGIAMGLWSARRITSLSSISRKRLGRVALWVMLPLLLSFGLVALGDRAHEAVSFRQGGLKEEKTVLVLEKEKRTSRSGRVFYEAGVVNPFTARRVTLRVDKETFARTEPLQDCVTLLIERAPNGAARLLMPLRWKVPCQNDGVRAEPRE